MTTKRFDLQKVVGDVAPNYVNVVAGLALRYLIIGATACTVQVDPPHASNGGPLAAGQLFELARGHAPLTHSDASMVSVAHSGDPFASFKLFIHCASSKERWPAAHRKPINKALLRLLETALKGGIGLAGALIAEAYEADVAYAARELGADIGASCDRGFDPSGATGIAVGWEYVPDISLAGGTPLERIQEYLRVCRQAADARYPSNKAAYGIACAYLQPEKSFWGMLGRLANYPNNDSEGIRYLLRCDFEAVGHDIWYWSYYPHGPLAKLIPNEYWTEVRKHEAEGAKRNEAFLELMDAVANRKRTALADIDDERDLLDARKRERITALIDKMRALIK